MARNQEKAQAMLNRFLQAKRDAVSGAKRKRPAFAHDCDNLVDAERFRREIVKEIARGVSRIQDGSGGEHRIRDLNDEINKLIRIKHHWERQIRVLGGADYVSAGGRMTDSDGSIALGTGNYYYFGAARELPGVKELFEAKKKKKEKISRYDMYKKIDADYYGYRDDEDGLLEALEKKQEEKAAKEAEAKWAEEHAGEPAPDNSAAMLDVEFDMETGELHKSHVPVPSAEEVEAEVLKRRKMELLSKYGDSQ